MEAPPQGSPPVWDSFFGSAEALLEEQFRSPEEAFRVEEHGAGGAVDSVVDSAVNGAVDGAPVSEEEARARRDLDEIRRDLDEIRRERDEILRDRDEILRDRDEIRQDRDEILRDRDEIRRDFEEVRRASECAAADAHDEHVAKILRCSRAARTYALHPLATAHLHATYYHARATCCLLSATYHRLLAPFGVLTTYGSLPTSTSQFDLPTADCRLLLLAIHTCHLLPANLLHAEPRVRFC